MLGRAQNGHETSTCSPNYDGVVDYFNQIGLDVMEFNMPVRANTCRLSSNRLPLTQAQTLLACTSAVDRLQPPQPELRDLPPVVRAVRKGWGAHDQVLHRARGARHQLRPDAWVVSLFATNSFRN